MEEILVSIRIKSTKKLKNLKYLNKTNKYDLYIIFIFIITHVNILLDKVYNR